MEYALGLLVVFLILFAPLGLAVHWLALGGSGRVQALPLALPTGLAVGVVLLAAARQAGIEAGSAVIPGLLFLGSVAFALAFRRWNVAWRSRELWGACALLLLALVLVVVPVVEHAGGGGSLTGPPGYATGREPVEQVATAEAASDDTDAGRVQVVRRAQDTADDRYTGFEQLLGLSVGLASPGAPAALEREWSAYSLYAPLLAVVAALMALPVFVLARWRGLRTLGLIAAILLGVTSPLALASAAMAQAPGLLAGLFTVCALTALLLARRDRGWHAIAGIYAAAALVTAGPLAFVPFIAVGVVWILLRGSTREHLAHTDTPTSVDRPIVAVALVSMFALYGTAAALFDRLELPWDALHETVLGAALAWPLTWIGPGLDLVGPSESWEIALALTGPALLAIGVAYGVSRKELRELAIILGSLAAIGVGLAVALIERGVGIALLEYSLLTLSPLLAIVCVRTVAVAREARESRRAGSTPRFVGIGPLLLLSGLLVLSLSAAGSSGARTVHAPPLAATAPPEGKTLIAAGDPWLSYMIEGERAPGGDVVDVDALSGPGKRSAVYGGYDNLVLGANPLASDPTSRYNEYSVLDRYAARLFVNTHTGDDGADEGESSRAAAALPTRHHPVEGDDAPADREVGGLLVPSRAIAGCTLETLGGCMPKRPVRGSSCTDDEMVLARSALDAASPRYDEDRASRPTAVEDALGVGVLTAFGGGGRAVDDAADRSRAQDAADEEERPRDPGAAVTARNASTEPGLLGAVCWDVPLSQRTKLLKVHVRDVGIILTSRDAKPDVHAATQEELGAEDEGREIYGGDWLRTTGEPVTISYGADDIAGRFDVTVEGSFGAGADAVFSEGNPQQEQTDALPAAFGGFSALYRERSIFGGNFAVRVPAGSAIEVGRVFLRPVGTLARSCDLLLPAREGGSQEVVTLATGADDTSASSPGIVARVAKIRTAPSGRNGVTGTRTARLVVGSYLQDLGMPRHLLVDWVEEFGSTGVEGAACAEGARSVNEALPGSEGAAQDTAGAGTAGDHEGAHSTAEDS